MHWKRRVKDAVFTLLRRSLVHCPPPAARGHLTLAAAFLAAMLGLAAQSRTAVPQGSSMNKGLTEVAGLRVGHHTMAGRPTGCTVVLVDEMSRWVESRNGGAPATRETDLLNPIVWLTASTQSFGGRSALACCHRGWSATRGAQGRIQDRRRGCPNSSVRGPVRSRVWR